MIDLKNLRKSLNDLQEQIDDILAAMEEAVPKAPVLLKVDSLVGPRDVLQLVAEAYGIPTEHITIKSNSPQYVVPRQVAQYLMHKRLHLSLPHVGRFTSCHHTTVMHSVEKVEALMAIDHTYKDLVSKLSNNLTAMQRAS